MTTPALLILLLVVAVFAAIGLSAIDMRGFGRRSVEKDLDLDGETDGRDDA